MRYFVRYISTLFLLLILFSQNSYAGYSVVSGTFTELINPAAVIRADPPTGTPASDTNWFIFREKQNVVLISDLTTDGSNLTDQTYTLESEFTPGSIASGTSVSSYIIISQRSTLTTPPPYLGEVDFTNKIIGVQFLKPTLENDGGEVALSYPGGFDVGMLNFDPSSIGADEITLSNGQKTLNFSFQSPQGMDIIRIVTATPEPSTYIIMGSTLDLNCYPNLN